jgi:hypothetical protein
MSMDPHCGSIRSFLQMFAEYKTLNHVSLARSGATNFLIRLQIEEAIQQNADFVIIGATSSDRIDIPVAESVPCPVKLQDVDYQGYASASEKNVLGEPKIVSDSMNNWTNGLFMHSNHKRGVSEDKVQAIKHHVANLHNFSLEQTRDYFIISDGIRRLQQLGKQFLFMAGPMNWLDWSWVGDNLWQDPEPWDTPYGVTGDTVNHTPQQAHDEFLFRLLEYTKEWKT